MDDTERDRLLEVYNALQAEHDTYKAKVVDLASEMGKIRRAIRLYEEAVLLDSIDPHNIPWNRTIWPIECSSGAECARCIVCRQAIDDAHCIGTLLGAKQPSIRRGPLDYLNIYMHESCTPPFMCPV